MNGGRPLRSHSHPAFEFEALEPRKLLSHTSGLDHALYMPEGFSAPTVLEIVELANSDESRSVEYELWAHYERDGLGEEIERVAAGTLAPGGRGSIGVWGQYDTGYRSPPFFSLVRSNEPYSLVLRSDSGDVSAILRHSDFGLATAQHFTDRSQTEYTLAGVRKDEDAARDFIVLFNSSNRDATIHLELEDGSGNIHRYSQSVPAERRGGWDVRALPGLPEGVYTARIASDEAIVLGGTRYALGRGAATIEIPARTLAEAGVIFDAEFDTDDGKRDDTFLFIANPGDADVQIQFRAFTDTGGIVGGPGAFTVGVGAGESARVSLRGRGYTDADNDLTLAYRADAPISVSVVAERRGLLAYVQPETLASDSWFFDRDRLVEPAHDEVVTEDVLLFNPTANTVEVRVTFEFSNGVTVVENRTLGSLEVEGIDGTFQFDEGGFPIPFEGLDFTISLESTGPIVAMLEHWNRSGRSATDATHGAATGTVMDLVDIAVF